MMHVNQFRRVAPRFQSSRAVADIELLSLWRRGLDTYAIAVETQMPEHEVERRLHAAKDCQRRDAEWNWPPEPSTSTSPSSQTTGAE